MTTDAQPQQQSRNGVNGSSGAEAPPPAPAAQSQARVKSHRSSVLAELMAEPEAKPAAPAKVEPEKSKAASSESDNADAAADAEDGAADEADEAAPAPKAKPAEEPDAETGKRLAAVSAAEKRSREKLAAERAEFAKEREAHAKERAEVESYRAKLAEYEKAAARARVDPAAALRALGLADADLADAAKQVYAAGKGEPANKEAAARIAREKEAAQRLEALEKRLADREQAEATQAEAAHIEREVTAYVADLKKAASAGTVSPLAKHFLAKSPGKTEAALRRATYELATETGDRPDFDDVLARYEKTRRAELEELGVDPDSLLTATPKKPDPEATKKTVAKTLNNDLSTPRVPRPKSSEKEVRADARAALLAGKLDD